MLFIFFFVLFSLAHLSAQPYSIERIFAEQVAQRDSSTFLSITYPADSSRLNLLQVRYGAWVRDTAATVTVDGDTMKVYPTGAVTGTIPLQPGWNTIPFSVTSPRGTQALSLHLYRIAPLKPLPQSPTVILDTLMTPSNDQVYYEPGEIRVQFMGSPGGKASFQIKGLTGGRLPMQARSPEDTGGRGGVYVGVYVIQPGDACRNKRIIFRLQGTDGRRVKRKSSVRITVLPYRQPLLAVTSEEYNLVRFSTGGEIFMDLPRGIPLQVVADLGDWFRVRISKHREAYVQKSTVELAPLGPPLPEANLYGISTSQDSNWVTFSLRLTEKVPFDLTQSIGPQRVSLYLYRTHFQDEWSVYPDSGDFIDHIDWTQVDDDILRFDVFLNTTQQWGFRGWYEGKTFRLALRKPPPIEKYNPFSQLTIALDAGHGGQHTGSVGATGLMEKDVNLVYTHYLAELLKQRGARVIVTRPDDRTMSLKERMDIAREANAHLFLWLHNNSTGLIRGPLERQGTSTYYTHLQGWPWARTIYPYLVNLGLKREGMVHRSYYITRQTDMPVFLVEGAFLSNPYDEQFLLQDENLRRLAQAVCQGLEAYLRALAQ